MPILFTSLDDFPDNIRKVLISEESAAANREILALYGVTDAEKKKAVLVALRNVFLGMLPVENFPSEVAKAAGLDLETAKPIARDFVGRRLFPLHEFLGGALALLMELGGDPRKYPKPVALPRLKTDEAVEQMLDALAENQKKGEVGEKWRIFFGDVVAGGREKFEADKLRAKITQKADGFGLTLDEATLIEQTMARVLAGNVVEPQTTDNRQPTTEKKNFIPSAPPTTPKPAPPFPPPVVKPIPPSPPKIPAPPAARADAAPDKGTKELAGAGASRIRDDFVPPVAGRDAPNPLGEQTPAPAIVSSPVDTKLFDSLVDSLVAKFPAPLGTDQMKKRLKDGIASRLKGVRASIDFTDWLKKKLDQGGMGLFQELASTYAQVVEEAKMTFEHIAEKTYNIQQKTDNIKQTTDNRQQTTENKQPLPQPPPSPPPPSAPSREAKVAINAKPKPTDELFKEVIGGRPIVPPKAPDAPSKAPVLIQDAEHAHPQTTHAEPAHIRPKMEDVSFAPKLMGPIDELQHMTIIDFRRLGPKPEIATSKIEDRIKILEQESFAKRLEGIAAWKQSEPYRLYEKILVESARQSVPYNLVAEQMASGGQATLTKEEIRAIIKLNEMLRKI